MIAIEVLGPTDELRFPDDNAGPLDALATIVAAGHRERSERWATTFAPAFDLSDQDFERPVVFDIDLAALGRGFTRDDLDGVARTLEAFDSFIMMHDGESVSHSPFLHREHELWRPSVINGNKVLAAMTASYTANFSGIDRSNSTLNGLCEHIERLFGCPADASVFLASGRTNSSGLHADTGELLIIPLEGPKHWEVLEPTVSQPLSPRYESGYHGAAAIDRTIAPGQALLIPRGWPHRVTPVGPTSISATVAFYRDLPATAVTAAANRAVHRPELRRGFGSRPDEVHRAIAAASNAADELFSPRTFESAVARRRATIPLRNHGRLAWSLLDGRLDPASTVSFRAPGGVMIAADPTTGANSQLAVAGRRISVSSHAVDLLTAVLSSHESSVQELVESRPNEPVAQLLAQLIADGLLDVNPLAM